MTGGGGATGGAVGAGVATGGVDGPTDATLKVLYASISHFLGHLKVINMISEALEKRINASMGNKIGRAHV